ncbi:MAG: hypothetical protein PHV74_03330 [Dehalococcoidia bacterium]|nr:hypothetical protein [Dehalococcoidia bacterium]
MASSYRFDKAARSEKYLVNTIFTHLLLHNNFSGMRPLFHRVFGLAACSQLPDDFEIVSDPDPLRDGSAFHPEVKKICSEFKQVAAPDLFLRWSHLCLVIEARFFADPSTDELSEQIRLQREVIEKVQPFTLYRDWEIKFAVLVINPARIRMGRDVVVLSWDEIISTMRATEKNSSDVEYCWKVLEDAKDRARKEATSSPIITFEKLKFADMLKQLPRLIEQGKVYVGFSGGLEELSTLTEQKLASRPHYEVSNIQWSENWITIDRFLHRVLEMKGYCSPDEPSIRLAV